MNIAGRESESVELIEAFNFDRAEFIIMYGRRRIGKTFLIEQLYSTLDCHFLHVTGIKDAPMKIQLGEFAKQVGKAFLRGLDLSAQKNWLDAFQELDKVINSSDSEKKAVLFLDELPWLASPKSGLTQAIEYYWNRYWKNNNRIKFIICGSNASWMINKIIHNKGGLHNRHTLRILLKPFKLSETKSFLSSLGLKLTNKQVAEIYMVTGGVPYYLSFIKKGMSAAQAINFLCFRRNGLLFDEFDKLFESLFDNAEIYKTIIRTVSSKREGVSLNELGKALKLAPKSGALARKLKDLEDAAFIKAFIPLGHSRQMKFYRICDEYYYFYLQWIEPLKGKMIAEIEEKSYWQGQLKSPGYYSWRGYTFESLCYKHLTEIKAAINLDQLEGVGAWRYIPRSKALGKGAQIDLIFDRVDGITTICEIKYTDRPLVVSKQLLDSIQNKVSVYKQRTRTLKHLNLALISACGVKAKVKEIDYMVSLEDLFKS